ncbi:MAG: hypothetical protein JWP01_3915 [Myxococcales bacterium]|nr:hypothetical protein [Myxococcales bacterium]
MRLLVGLCLAGALGCADSGSSIPKVCPETDALPDAGTLPALKAQRCNVSGSMGMRQWYRLSATLPDSTIVQLELYDAAGAFAGGKVRTGSFPIETSFGSCGVCLRAIADKGMATQTEYFGTGGTVNITAVGAGGAPFSATITGATFAEVDAQHAPVSNGCTGSLAGVTIDGVVVDMGGGGTGGGGGGGGGGNGCPATVGD